MKKIFIIIALLFTQLFYAQVSNTKTTRIVDATTAFGKNISIGTQVYNVATGELWIANTAVISTATLTTASASFDGADTIINIATTGEINTGTIDNKAISPLGLAGSQLQTDVTANNAKTTFPGFTSLLTDYGFTETTYEGYSETGTGATLISKLGDGDNSANNTHIEVDDQTANKRISLYAKDYNFKNETTGFDNIFDFSSGTQNRTFTFPNIVGQDSIALVSQINAGIYPVRTIEDLDDLITGSTSGIWAISAAFTLDANKTIPSGVTLRFGEHKISSGGFTLTGTNTNIDAPFVQIFDTNQVFAGDWFINEVNPIWFGAKGDGVSDDTVAIQKSINSTLSPVTFIPRGDYLVSSPIILPGRTTLKGQNPAGVNYCTSIIASTSSAWAQYRGVIETSNYSDYSGTADYWHAGKIIDLQIKDDGVTPANKPEYGLVVFAAGEQSLISGVAAKTGTIAAFFSVGYHAVLQIFDSSGWGSDGYGLKMSNHPDGTFPNTGVAKGSANGGSSRIYGFSGDNNLSGFIYANGTQTVEMSGIKSEYNNPCIVIGGSGTGNTRQRWNITGYRVEHGTSDTSRPFVRIEDTAQPSLFIGAGAMFNNLILIEDLVSGKDVTGIGDGNITIYDPYQNTNIISRQINNAPSFIHQQGSPLDSWAANRLTAEYNNPSSIYSMEWRAQVSATDTYQLLLRANTSRYKFISFDGTGAKVKYLGWDGVSNTTPLIEFDAAKNISMIGTTTFTYSPIVPTPTTDYQASTKKYVDDTVNSGLNSLDIPVISNSNLNANHYAKRVLNNGGVFESIDQLFYDLNNVTSESLQFTPNAVAVDKLYGIQTSDYENGGLGDFVFTRTGIATKTNVNNVIETVLADTPRIDYTFNPSGELLLEPSRINSAKYSEEFDNANWTKTKIDVTANNTFSPDGTLTAEKNTPTALSGVHQLKTLSGLIAPTNNYIFSIYAKSNGYKNILLWADGEAGGVGYNLETLTTFRDENNLGHTIKDVGNGWRRITVVVPVGVTSSYSVYLYDNAGTPSITFTGDGVSSVYLWGAQLEVGDYATSYIPTTTATVTRNAETVTGLADNTVINTQAGGIYIESAALYDSATSRHVSVSDGTADDQAFVGYDDFSNRIEASYWVGGVTEYKLSYVVADETVNHKILFSWAEDDLSLWVDGVEEATVTTATMSAADTFDTLQFADGDGTNVFEARLRELKIFTHKPTDTEAEALTSKDDYIPKHLARTDVDPYFTKDVTVQKDVNIKRNLIVEGTITTAPRYLTQGGGTYTLVSADAQYVINFTSGSAKTITIPTNATDAIPIGSWIVLFNTGAGDLTFGLTGITLNDDLTDQTLVQYAKRTLYKTGTDIWLLSY